MASMPTSLKRHAMLAGHGRARSAEKHLEPLLVSTISQALVGQLYSQDAVCLSRQTTCLLLQEASQQCCPKASHLC